MGDPKELFKAVTSQCVWCKEQWPILATGGHMIHVGPFTKDKLLWSTACKAEPIRAAFEYVTYKGGKQIVFEAREPVKLKKIIEDNYGAMRRGLNMRIDSPKNRSFWRTGIRCSLDVAEWPRWMRSAGQKDGVEDTPPERLKQYRDELRFFDECDFITRQQCSDNFQYRPIWRSGNLVQPNCNGGFGCTTCWGVYEAEYEEFNRLHPCDF
jgi:hypothetical protein